MVWKVKATDEQVRVSPQTGRLMDKGSVGIGARRGLIELSAAKNEYVSFQLVIGPLPGQERAFKVEFYDLEGPVKISRRNFEAYVAWYIKSGKRWWPEVLLPLEVTGGVVAAPFRENAVPGQRYQAVWVDLFVPREARAGSYSGRLKVSDGKNEVEVGIQLRVLPIVIPDECSMLYDLNNYADGISAGWPELVADVNRHRSARYRRIEKAFFRAAHEHRGCMHYLPYGHSSYIPPTFAPELAGHGKNKHVKSWRDFDRHFGSYFDGSAFSGTKRGPIPVPHFWMPLCLDWPADFKLFGKKGYETEWRGVGKEMVQHFREKGWNRTSFDMFLNHKQRYRFYPWDCEEVRFRADNAIHYIFRDLWRGTYDWPNTKPVKFTYTLGITWTFGIDTLTPMREFVEVWVGELGGWHQNQLPGIHARGQQVWACSGSPCIYDAPVAANWWPLRIWMRDLDGFMPWLSLGWGKDPWSAPPLQGRTTLFYPGARFGIDGPVVSQRLKVMRNAMQTAELFELAARKVGRDLVKKRINKLLGLAGITDWLAKMPAYAKRKPPSQWTKEDFATEKPSVAQWQNYNANTWRSIKATAAELAVGKKKK